MADASEQSLHGNIHSFKTMLAYVDSMLLRSAVELRLGDIFHDQAEDIPLSVSAIASRLPEADETVDLNRLGRVMRFLAYKKIFTKQTDPHTGDLYGPTPASDWLRQNTNLSLAPMVISQTTINGPTPWSKLSEAVLRGGTPYKLHHGVDLWSHAGSDPLINNVFNAAMVCSSEMILDAILAVYQGELAELDSLVDVGGGVGAVLGKITKLCPNLKGINFDLPHVVASAPEYPNVEHVGGSMFEEIPKADAVFTKWILHNFGDEQSLKILENCRKAIPDTGKVIIAEIVLEPEVEGPETDIGLALDMVMLCFSNGIERTEKEWRELVQAAGFSRCNIIKLPSFLSLIEAYP